MLVLFALACTSGPATLPTPIPGDAGDYSGTLGPGPSFDPAHSRFSTVVYPSDAIAVFSGRFAETPPLQFHQESERIGNCRLMTYTPSSCDPTCEPGAEACIEATCQPLSTAYSDGPVVWDHGGGTVTVAPDDTHIYFATAAATEPVPMALEHAGLRYEVPGAHPLEPDGDWATALASRGEDDGVLRWTDAYEGARVRLRMTDCTATHGGIAAAEIECEGPDTGELVIPAPFLDALAAGDWSHGECGGHSFERYHASADPDDPGMRFESIGPGGLFYRFD